MNKKEFKRNVSYLEKNDVEVLQIGLWENHPFSCELECYTDAGGDMIIDVEEVSRECLGKYLDEYDINREVVLWWPDGEKRPSVPFSNIKEHYEDLEEWLETMRGIIDGMPY